MKVLALIPARAGSKGVPGKNKKLLAGKPLIQYTIEAAKTCPEVTHIVVNSDDTDILALARTAGVEAQERAANLATDKAPMVPVIADAIARTPGGTSYDALLLLQPTSPLRTAAHITSAIQLLADHPDCDGVLSVQQLLDHHPARIKKLTADGYLTDFCMPEEDGAGRTELKPDAYIRNGAIYLVRMSYFLREHTVKRGRMLPMIMSAEESVNIDEPVDFLMAEALLRRI